MSDVPPSAFCSYSRADAEFALKLAEDLKAAGANVWMDQLDIEPGAPWDRTVEEALAAASRILVILSPASVSSDNVSDELSFALSKHKRIIPVLHRECNVPFRLARLQHIDFTHDYERGLKALVKTLSAPQPASASGAGAAEATNLGTANLGTANLGTANLGTAAEATPEKTRQDDTSGSTELSGKRKRFLWMSAGIATCLILILLALMARSALQRSNEQRAEQEKKTEEMNARATPPASRKLSGEQGGSGNTKTPAPTKVFPNAAGGNSGSVDSTSDRFQLAASAKLISNEQETKRYAFALSIQAPDVFKNNIARVNYDLVYASNTLALISDDPSKNFEALYDGWGCYQKVDVTVFFKNKEQPRTKTFNMCSVLGW
jgi:hypothetical protein